MKLPRNGLCRPGTTAVEFAVTGSLAVFLIISLMVGAMGVFRFQEVSHLAREGSRYASVHGGKYSDYVNEKAGSWASDGLPAPPPAVSSSAQVRDYLLPKSTLLAADKLTVTASWSVPSSYAPVNIVQYTDVNPNLVTPGQVVINNYVTVTVSYQWFPELYLVGPFNLTSSSTIQMAH